MRGFSIRHFLLLIIILIDFGYSQETAHLPDSLQTKFEHALQLIGNEQYEQAVEELEVIIKYAPAFGMAYRKIADAYILSGDVNTAETKFSAIYNEQPDNLNALYVLSRIDYHKQRLDAAIDKLQKCLEKNPEFPLAYLTVTGLPDLFNEKGALDEGIQYFQSLLNRYPENGYVMYALGRLYFFKEDYAKSEAYLKQSIHFLPIQESAYVTLQNIYENNSDYNNSVLNAQQFLNVAFQINSLEMAANSLVRLGSIKFRLGNFRSALEDLSNAISLSRRIGVKKLEAFGLLNAGAVYATLGNYRKALEYFQTALELTKILNLSRSETRTLLNIGLANKDMGQYNRALEFMQKALRKAREKSYTYEQGNCLIGIAEAYEQLGKTDSAAVCYRQAYEIFRAIQSDGDMGYTLVRLGGLFFKQQKYDVAHKYYEDALNLGRKSKDKQIIWEALAGLGAADEKLGDVSEAIQNYQNAIKIYDEIRQSLNVEMLALGFLDDKYQVYPSLINLLAESNQTEKAFYFAELYKSKNLLQVISKGQVLLSELLPDSVKFELAALRDKIAGLREAYATELEKPKSEQDNKKIVELDHQITDLELKKGGLIQTIREQYPEYYQLTSAEPLAVVEIQQHLLSPKQLLLEYIVGNDKILLFTISKDTITYSTIPVAYDSLKQAVQQVSALFRNEKEQDEQLQIFTADLADFSVPPAYRLAQMLLSPVKERLSDVEELIIVPDDLLNYVPFEALVLDTTSVTSRYDFANAEFLIEKIPVSYASSASILGFYAQHRHSGHTKTLLAFGNPLFFSRDTISDISATRNQLMPLPHSEAEVNRIGKILQPADIYTGKTATENIFLEKGRDYQIIHIASHFLVNDQDPMFSRLVFSEGESGESDGFLNTYEIFGIKLNADLVTLSACNTALGRLSKGEGLVGISRAFLTSGVPGLVVSLWSVDDDATSQIMANFYEYLAQGYKKNRALQLAKIDFINQTDNHHRDPFYWAPFILIGDVSPIELHARQPFLSAYWGVAILALLTLLGGWLYFKRKDKVAV
jgi:CHAT domain-containing protein/Tfp pilus assembly protein PilF